MPIAAGLYYSLCTGESRERPPVVLIHGAGGTHLHWPPAIRRLAGYQVMAPDLPGHGKSPGAGRQNVAAYAGALLDFLAAVGLHRAVFVGHALGGAIALQLALQHGDHVVGAALLASGPRLEIPPAWIAAAGSQATIARAIEPQRRLAFSPATDAALVEAVLRRVYACRPSVLQGDLLASRDFDAMDPRRLAAITAPVLILCGAEDRLVPVRSANYLSVHLGDARVAEVPAAGHMLMLEQPAAAAAALRDFLAGLPYQVGSSGEGHPAATG